MTEHSLGTVTALEAALAKVRRTGLAYDYCESNPDVACVAAPIVDHEGHVTAAMSLSFPVTRWSVAYRDALGAQLLDATSRLSRTLGAPNGQCNRARDRGSVLVVRDRAGGGAAAGPGDAGVASRPR